MQWSPSEQLLYSTVRIECQSCDGQISVGTAFFFAFFHQKNKSVPVLVTNKHVIAGSSRGRFRLHCAGESGHPAIGANIDVELDNFSQRWIAHPDPQVDLCIMPIAPLLHKAQTRGSPIFYIPLTRELIPNRKDMHEFTALEEIVMVGYPIGIWDEKNNLPVIRRGITATHPAFDYEGRLEFLIDAACFPGSSGSPVFLFNVGNYVTKDGATVIGSRIKLLGVLYAGPQYTAEGQVEIVEVPTQQKPVALFSIPTNLGICIKSQQLIGFEPVLRQLLESSPNA